LARLEPRTDPPPASSSSPSKCQSHKKMAGSCHTALPCAIPRLAIQAGSVSWLAVETIDQSPPWRQTVDGHQRLYTFFLSRHLGEGRVEVLAGLMSRVSVSTMMLFLLMGRVWRRIGTRIGGLMLARAQPPQCRQCRARGPCRELGGPGTRGCRIHARRGGPERRGGRAGQSDQFGQLRARA